MRRIRRLIQVGVILITALAILDQVVRDPEYRTWNGQVFGIPYDFRAPTLDRVRAAVWSPEEPRLLNPHVFGVGWTPNVGRLFALAQSGLRQQTDQDQRT